MTRRLARVPEEFVPSSWVDHALALPPSLLDPCSFSSLPSPPQYHQLQDEYFTSAVVLALILAALFGLVYLLIIPQ